MSLLSVPLKTILPLHSQASDPALPDGYVACEGQTLAVGTHDIDRGASPYTVPDMRNRFPLGADRTKAFQTPAVAGELNSDAPGPDGVGGAPSVTLTASNIPNHGHTATTDNQGAHSHAVTTNSAGGHNHGDGDYVFTDGALYPARSGGYMDITCTTYNTSDAGSHGHTFTMPADGNHYAAHVVAIGSARGANGYAVSAPVSLMPRFGTVVYIIKVKH